MANISFSSLIHEGTSKMLQSSKKRKTERVGSGILPISIKLEQGNCHQEAPNNSRDATALTRAANPRKSQKVPCSLS